MPARRRFRRFQKAPREQSTGVYNAQGNLIGADPDPNVRLQMRKDDVGNTERRLVAEKSPELPGLFSCLADAKMTLCGMEAVKSRLEFNNQFNGALSKQTYLSTK